MADKREKIHKPAVIEISGSAARNQLVIGLGIKIGGDADLLQIAGADGFLCGLPGFSKGRDQNGQKDADDGDNDEQFDQRKSFLTVHD